MTVESLSQLLTLVHEPGVTDVVYVRGSDAYYRHLNPGEAVVNATTVFQAADGGVWAVITSRIPRYASTGVIPIGYLGYVGTTLYHNPDGTPVGVGGSVNAASLLTAGDDLTDSQQTTFRGHIGVRTLGRAHPRRNVSVHAGGYITPTTGTLNVGASPGVGGDVTNLVWLNCVTGNAGRVIRHMPVIDRVQIQTAAASSFTSLVVFVARNIKAAGTYWRVVAQTDNLANYFTNAGVQDIRLATPLTGVRQGDHIGVAITLPSPLAVLRSQTQTNCHAYWLAATLADGMLTGATAALNTCIPIRVFGPPADIILKGDSIAGGHKASASLFDSVSTQAWYGIDAMQLLANDGGSGTHGGFICANHSIQGDTMTAIESVWSAHMIEQKPKLGVLWLTGNDIGAAGTNEGNVLTTVKDTFISKLTAMLDAAYAVDLPLVVMTISPRGGWEAWRKSARNQYNTEAQALVTATGYGGLFSWLDLDPVVEDPAAPDALLAAYADADGYHYSSAGQTAVATALRDHVFAGHAHKL